MSNIFDMIDLIYEGDRVILTIGDPFDPIREGVVRCKCGHSIAINSDDGGQDCFFKRSIEGIKVLRHISPEGFLSGVTEGDNKS